MALEQEITAARKEIVADGYDMSIGELVNLYRDNELQINPAYQRLFRWPATTKTRFIESILLGLPLPPIFVFQQTSGVWELIDGLQRISTVLEFVGILKDPEGVVMPPLRLSGTQLLPSLAEKVWEPIENSADEGIGPIQQIQFKRARLRVEILRQESDPQAKYELFQRLNSGGVQLSPQELRNSISIMIDPSFQTWLLQLAERPSFLITVDQTETGKERQSHVELAVRLLAFRNSRYKNGLDVHEYLDDALVTMAQDPVFDRASEQSVIERTFDYLNESMGASAFKRWDGQAFSGKFLISVYEVVALGVSRNINGIGAMPIPMRSEFIRQRCKALWGNAVFTANSGAGVRGTTRLTHLLPMAVDYFLP